MGHFEPRQVHSSTWMYGVVFILNSCTVALGIQCESMYCNMHVLENITPPPNLIYQRYTTLLPCKC